MKKLGASAVYLSELPAAAPFFESEVLSPVVAPHRMWLARHLAACNFVAFKMTPFELFARPNTGHCAGGSLSHCGLIDGSTHYPGACFHAGCERRMSLVIGPFAM